MRFLYLSRDLCPSSKFLNGHSPGDKVVENFLFVILMFERSLVFSIICQLCVLNPAGPAQNCFVLRLYLFIYMALLYKSEGQ
jgi:hypothetical protein